jgi:hypothetical protein
MTKPIEVPSFRGEGYETGEDHLRLGAQHLAVKAVMKDHLPHTLKEIAERSGAPEASVSAQLRFLRTLRFGGHVVAKARPKDKGGTFFYTLDPEPGQPLIPEGFEDPRPFYTPPGMTPEDAKRTFYREHPPQGDLFGKWLRSEARKEKQA